MSGRVSTAYDSGRGTLYVHVYEPARGAIGYRWPAFEWEQPLERSREESRTRRLLETSVA